MFRHHSFVVMLMLFCCFFQRGGAAANISVSLDTGSIVQASRTLAQRIEDAVGTSNGDARTQNIHLLLAFSTGHFASDPVKAMAGRAVARLLIERYLVPGDTVSVYAWEIDLWDNHPGAQNPITITGPESARQVVSLFPLTPKTGSVGGHDTENAIVQLARLPTADAHTVMVLITNDAASVSAPGGRVIGQNAPAYLGVLSHWNRGMMTGNSGASVQLPIVAYQGDTTRDREQDKLDIVLVTPRQFQGQPLTDNTSRPLPETFREPKMQLSVNCSGHLAHAIPRGDDITDVTIHWGDGLASVHATNGATIAHRYKARGSYKVYALGETRDGLSIMSDPQIVKTGADGGAFLTLLLLIAVTSAVAYGGWKAWAFRRPYLVSVCGIQFALADKRAPEVICQIVGKGYAGPQDNPLVTLDTVKFPVSIARVVKKARAQVKVEGDQLDLSLVNSEPVMMKSRVIRPSDEHTLLFTGEFHEPGRMPASIRAEVTVKIAHEE